jgi:hypothetical protein
VLQQSGGDQPDAILYPRRPHQSVGGIVEADDLGFDRQRIEPL